MKKFFIAFALCALIFSLGQSKKENTLVGDEAPRLVVHEWGVIRSNTASNRSENSAEMPQFVHTADFKAALSKAEDPNNNNNIDPDIQKIRDIDGAAEKPLIYFYADKEISLDCEIDCRKAPATYWWPASDIDTTVYASLADKKRELQKAQEKIQRMEQGWDENWDEGVYQRAEELKKAISDLEKKIKGDSKNLAWKNIQLGGDNSKFPKVDAGNWFETARETDATPLSVNNESEKFLFYEGAGDFGPSAEIRFEGGKFRLENKSAHAIHDLFFIHEAGGKSYVVKIPELKKGETIGLELGNPLKKTSAEYRKATIDAMRESLTTAGLYEKEAVGLMKIWGKSFFAKSGTRVIYRASQEQYDEWYPMKLSVKPAELKRVMLVVGEFDEKGGK